MESPTHPSVPDDNLEQKDSDHSPGIMIHTDSASDLMQPLITPGNITPVAEALVLSDSIKPFLQWCYHETFDQSVKSRYQQVKALTALSGGIIIGGLSVASIYPLGGSFGNVLCDYLAVTEPTTRTAIYGFFAINALMPMLCLSCIEAKELFTRLASSSNTQAITKVDRKNLRRGFTCIAYVLAAFSALSPLYATIEVFADAADWLKWLTIPTSFIGPVIFKAASELRLLDKALSYYPAPEKAVIKGMQKELQTKWQWVENIIKDMSDEPLDRLFFDVLGDKIGLKQADAQQQNAYHNLTRLFTLPLQYEDIQTSTVAEKATKKPSRLSYFFKSVGFFTGAASAYVYYTLAESAALYLCDYLNIENQEQRTVIQQLSSSLAVIPWAALGAEATQAVFEKAYEFLRCKKASQSHPPKTSYWIPAIASFEGICSATPPTYLAIQALNNTPWYAQLLLIPAFLGPASIRTVAVARLMTEGAAYVKTFQPESTLVRKEQLLAAVNKITTALNKVPDEQLSQLYFDLMNNYPQHMIKHDLTSPPDRVTSITSSLRL